MVNLDKSNIIVFRNGGHLAAREKWYFDGKELTVVNAFKYLGVFFTTRLSFSCTLEDLAERARRAISAIFRMLWSINEHSPNIFFKLFDCQIQPILTYGSEVWGLCNNQECIERVNLSAQKRFLGVNIRAPRHLIYAETGRYPLYVNTYCRCIKYWLKLTMMDSKRYPRKAYNMLLFLQKQNYVTWACSVRNVLYRFGFGFVWEAQGVGHTRQFVSEFKRRLIDCFCQGWNSSMASHEYFNIFSTYKSSIMLSSYLKCVRNINVRKVVARFRIGMSPLRHHFLRYRQTNETNSYCPFCDQCQDTELHFLLICPHYIEIRSDLIPRRFYKNPCLFRMSMLLASDNENVVKNVALYIVKALLIRSEHLRACE